MKQKIAILGGGVGSMTTAFYLSSFPGWADRFEITVYQLGWRLGGKGASGRNQALGDRIEEHGLHMFFGFYENAFATMQRVYAELGRNPAAPLPTWDAAWKPHDYFVLQEERPEGYLPWEFDFPRNSGVPGVGGVLPTPWQMIQTVLGWAKELFEKTTAAPHHTTVTESRLGEALDHALGRCEAGVRHLLHSIAELIGEGPQTLVPNTFLHLAHYHACRLPDDAKRHAAHDHAILKGLLRDFITWLKAEWRQEAKLATEIRRALILLDLSVAAVIGMIEDDLIVSPVDWFKIDHVRFEEWLQQHGAEPASTASPPVLLLSEIVFARWAGVGAGTCLHYTMRLALTYKGAFAWKMQAGMGDTIFAPFYEVLRRRGVKFEFFQSVEELGVGRDAAGAKVIDTIRIGVQVRTKGEYRPLYDVEGLPCWPSEPLYDQIEDGEKLRASGENLENWWTRWQNVDEKVLRRGEDFDVVVLGIAPGAFPYICKQLIDDHPPFARMVKEVLVTETQAAQLWTTPDYAGMGWALGPDPVIGTYAEPFDTIADMTHLIPREAWKPGTVGAITYLTAQLHEPLQVPSRSDWQYPFGQEAKVRRNLEEWLGSSVRPLWPAATQTSNPGELNWWLLVDPEERAGRARLDAQFWIATWNPSDRYVMSVPGSVWSRLPSAGMGYANLVGAGDWTLNAIASGCVESAVMSAMHASRALCGVPAQIVGDRLPDGGDVPRPPAPPPSPALVKGTYVEYDGNPTPLQPYVAEDVTMYNFVVQADPAKLQALLDRNLNLGGPVTYRPLGPFLSFVAATMGPMAPRSPKAWLDEKDFGFWIPVVAGALDPVSGDWNALRPAFYIPYLWVDDYLPQQAGREVFGYQKGVGVLHNPASPQDPAEFTIDALVVPEFGAPGNPASAWQWKRLVTVARKGGGEWGELVAELESMAALGEAVIARLVEEFRTHSIPVPTLALLRAMLADAAKLDVPMVFLKQFRDVADGTRACYQAIVEAPNRMTSGPVRAGWLKGDWELAIEQFASVRMIDNLGLRVVDGKVPAAFHFWVQFGFTAEPGRVVYRVV